MSTERGKTPLVPPGLQILKLVSTGKNAKFCLEKKAKRLITLKRIPIRFPLEVSLKSRNHAFCLKVPEKPLKPPRLNR